jgi:putative membrane protein
MNPSATTASRADVRDYLAAERTFLAWIRTGLALMGFGFVVARFGLFLQQLRLIDHAPALPNSGLSLWFGTALIATGIVVNLSSAWRHVRLVRELDRGQPECARSLTQTVATALFLAVVGLAMAIYLISVRGTANLQSSNRVSGFKGAVFANSDIEIPFGIKEVPWLPQPTPQWTRASSTSSAITP